MSALETTNHEQDTEAPDRGLIRDRKFTAEIARGEGRQVDVRVVPYNTPTKVSDNGKTSYLEEWVPGVFDRHLRAANRVKVLMNFEHQPGISGVVGHGVALREDADGFYGTFEFQKTQDADKVLQLVEAGVLEGVSLEAIPRRSVRTASGVVRRMSAILQAIALCRNPAFEQAQILALREDDEALEVERAESITFDESLLPIPIDPERVELWRQLGVRLPQRFQAHPEPADPPALEAGTSEDGHRQPIGNHTFSEERNEHIGNTE